MVTGGGNPKSGAQEPEVGPTSLSGVSSVQQRALEPLDLDLLARALEFLKSHKQESEYESTRTDRRT